MEKIVVTGGNGHFGSRIVERLQEKGYEVIVLDKNEARGLQQERRSVQSRVVDLNDYQEVERAMTGGDAVLHVGAISSPGGAPPSTVFSNNVVSTYNVLEAACHLGYRKAVIASSESAYGFPWAHRPLSPLYLPVDENHPLIPHDCYGMSKVVNEFTGESMYRRNSIQVVSLRLSTICDSAVYEYLRSCLKKPDELRRILWSYVDIRDAVEACLLSLEKDGLGYSVLNIAADETCSDIHTRELIHRFFPDVPEIKTTFDKYEALYSNKEAKLRLGWEPRFRWREQMC